MNVQSCRDTWEIIQFVADYNTAYGKGFLPYVAVPQFPRRYPYFSPMRDDRKVVTILSPTWSMTYRMLTEASREVLGKKFGASMVCGWGQEFYVKVTARGKQVMWGKTIERFSRTAEE